MTLDSQGRDKVNTSVSIVPDSTDPNIGNFSAAVGKVPAQLALTATDKDGNTSEFAVLTSHVRPGYPAAALRLGLSRPGDHLHPPDQQHRHGRFHQYPVHRLLVAWLALRACADRPDIALAAGESKPVTLTLTLPTGADPRVRSPE